MIQLVSVMSVSCLIDGRRKTSVNPYYEENGITIYHDDCRQVLPSLPKVDLLLTDPPYGIAVNTDYSRFPKGGDRHKPVHADDEPFDPSPFLRFKEVILWGANNYANKLPSGGGWLVWQKQLNSSQFMSDCELAWFKNSRMIRCFDYAKNEGEYPSDTRPRFHPTEKSVLLMKWCLSFTKSPLVLDPFMGSGTTLRAAKDLGRKAIGIEIEEKYCEIAANRLRQEVLQFA